MYLDYFTSMQCVSRLRYLQFVLFKSDESESILFGLISLIFDFLESMFSKIM